MKSEIILTVVFASLCLCERRQRSTVLTDESKRVVEHFDFSNFDRQEALNYLDRQRFENQIRGKRSHTKFKRDRQENDQKTSSTPSKFINPEDIETLVPNEVSRAEEISNTEVKPEIFENEIPDSSNLVCEKPLTPFERAKDMYRNRRGHRLKNKRKYKYGSLEDADENTEKVDEHKSRRKKKKSKKKKKKKKKKRHYWDKWSAWSPCSVTCGRGRKIRWRKCIAKNCTNGELEMGEKTCQLPACNLLTKLLGL